MSCVRSWVMYSDAARAYFLSESDFILLSRGSHKSSTSLSNVKFKNLVGVCATQYGNTAHISVSTGLVGGVKRLLRGAGVWKRGEEVVGVYKAQERRRPYPVQQTRQQQMQIVATVPGRRPTNPPRCIRFLACRDEIMCEGRREERRSVFRKMYEN